MWKKFFVILLLVFSLSCCYGQESELDALFTGRPDIEALNQNLTTLEQNWNLLIVKNENLKNRLIQSEQSLTNVSSLLTENMNYSLRLEQQLEKSEQQLRIWKGIAITLSVTLCVSMTTVTLIIYQMSK